MLGRQKRQVNRGKGDSYRGWENPATPGGGGGAKWQGWLRAQARYPARCEIHGAANSRVCGKFEGASRMARVDLVRSAIPQ